MGIPSSGAAPPNSGNDLLIKFPNSKPTVCLPGGGVKAADATGVKVASGEGSPTVDNPTLLRSTGITQLALPWALGGYEYGGSINQIFHGWVGDIRIVGRPLSTSEFMIAR